MARREYQAGRPTTLTVALNISGTSFTIANDTNWPDGADYDFWVTVDGGTAQEERILCSARTGTTVTVATSGRGKDGTTETNHAVGTGTSGLSKRLLKNWYGFFDHFVLVAQDPEWRKFTSGRDRRNIQVISNGISSDAVPSDPQRRASKDPIKIGTISRLEKESPW